MSSDYALLFGRSEKARSEAWQPVLSATRAFGAKYAGVVTRLDWIEATGSWQLTAETRQAHGIREIRAVMAQWDGLALELETRFGPMKLLAWDIGPDKSGFGIFENSYAFALQSEEPDVMEIFEHVSLEVAEFLQTELAVLVGDPALRDWNTVDLGRVLAEAPGPAMEPLLYWAACRSDAQGNVPHASHQWIQRTVGAFRIYVNPSFPSAPTDR
jgi:hypothetical protein